MNRRAEGAEETRRRIVEATAQLHDRKGVAATTYRDIAELADVGVGTVYHHFPTYDEAITACGTWHLEHLSLPGPEIFAGIHDPALRLRTLVGILFDRYEHMAGYAVVRPERAHFAALDASLAAVERALDRLIDAALRPFRCGARRRATAAAILDYAVYERLMASGMRRTTAIREMTNVLLRTVSTKGSPR